MYAYCHIPHTFFEYYLARSFAKLKYTIILCLMFKVADNTAVKSNQEGGYAIVFKGPVHKNSQYHTKNTKVFSSHKDFLPSVLRSDGFLRCVASLQVSLTLTH